MKRKGILLREARSKRLHTIWSTLLDNLEKVKLWGWRSSQWLPGSENGGGVEYKEEVPGHLGDEGSLLYLDSSNGFMALHFHPKSWNCTPQKSVLCKKYRYVFFNVWFADPRSSDSKGEEWELYRTTFVPEKDESNFWSPALPGMVPGGPQQLGEVGILLLF